MMNVSPKHYVLSFEPDFASFTFKGKERLRFSLSSGTDVLELHAAELDITSCSVVFSGKTLSVSVKIKKKEEKIVIKLPEKISGDAELVLEFTGVLNDKLVGFYRSEYVNGSGTKKYLATTQFEAADARRAFPCVDEPAAKATFDVTLVVDEKLAALSNMPIVDEKKEGAKKHVRFERTPVMSTYLLYLAVGDFEHLEDRLGDVAVRVVTVQGKKEQGRFALELTKNFLTYFNDYFGIPYPLPKLDMIAVPDFASGAMENWGAITFREAMLLFDEKTSSTDTKQRIAEVIAHELAHQWFGNLVTMKWWNDLWLNESFATFMATKAVATLFPAWDFWDQFLKLSMNEAMSLDALKSSHPIDVEVKSPAEIREIFDDISYDKGGCVLRMLEDFVGEQNFRHGLQKYLTVHRYANATTNDLWAAIASVSGKPVQRMMDSWVRQMGYPIVYVRKEDKKLVLKQNRFLLETNHGEGQWLVPVSYAVDGQVGAVLLEQKEISLPLSVSWIKVNVGHKGFYRTAYPTDMLQILKKQIDQRALGPIDRWGVQNDLFAQCVAGCVSLRTYLDFVRSYATDENYLATADVAESLYALYVLCAGESTWENIVRFNTNYLEVLYKRLGWEPRSNEKHTDVLLRSFVLSALGRHGHPEVLAEAQKRFLLFLKNPDSLRGDLRSTVYSLAAWQGDEKTYKNILKLYKKTPSQEEKVRFLAALSNFAREDLLLKTLDLTLKKDVRSQHCFIPLGVVANNIHGKDLVWPWLREHWKKIAVKAGKGSPLLQRIVGVLSVTTDMKTYGEIDVFFKENMIPGIERKVAQTLEKIRIHTAFVERVGKEI